MYVVIAYRMDTGKTEVLGIARTVEEIQAMAYALPKPGGHQPWTRIEYFGPFEPGDLKSL